jgi:hypothetical protein
MPAAMRLTSSRRCGWTVSIASPQQQEQRPDVCLHPCMLASQAGFLPALRLALNDVRRRGDPLVPSVVLEQWAALMRGANIHYGVTLRACRTRRDGVVASCVRRCLGDMLACQIPLSFQSLVSYMTSLHT